MANRKRNRFWQFVIVKLPSLLTVAIIGYMMYVFNWRYIPDLFYNTSKVLAVILCAYMNINTLMLVWAYIKWLLSDPGYTTDDIKEKFASIYQQVYQSPESRQSEHTNSSRIESQKIGFITYNQMEEMKRDGDIENQNVLTPENADDREKKNKRKFRRMETPHANKGRAPNRSTTFRYWSSCDNIKPPRCHHWSMCQKCVLRMDHHCPWIGNCVGFNNHKYFIWFLIYALNGTILMSAWVIISIAWGVAQKDEKSGEADIHYLIAWVLSTAIACALLLLISVHMYMLGTNETTLEMGEYGKKNPFDMKDWYSNFQIVFGDDFKTWFIPIPPKNRECNGIEYTYHLI